VRELLYPSHPKIPITKFQAPNKFQAPITNGPNRLELGELVLVCDLEFGAWNFD
jgi:hypothetical protein